TAHFPARRVECHEAGIRCGPAPEGVKAAPELIATLAHLPAVAIVRGIPNSIRLKGKHARAANFPAEQPTHRQRIAAQHLGFPTEARPPREPTIEGIAPVKLRREAR